MVVPVFDEEAVLERSLERLFGYLAGRRTPFELICVDDGSRDRSGQIIARFAERVDGLGLERVRVLGFPENRGKGAAVRAGVLASRGARVLFMDADLSTELEATERVLAALGSSPVVFASRRAAGAVLLRPQGRVRRVLGRGFALLAARAAGARVGDVTCGFKGFTRAAAADLFGRARLNGWAFDAELLAMAAAGGWSVAEVGVAWGEAPGGGAVPARRSKVRVPAAVARSLLDLFWIARARRAGAWSPRRGPTQLPLQTDARAPRDGFAAPASLGALGAPLEAGRP